MPSASNPSANESQTVSPPLRAATPRPPPPPPASAYQPLATTPAPQTMKENFKRNILRHLESIGYVPTAEHEQDEETEDEADMETEVEDEVDVAPNLTSYTGKASEEEVLAQEQAAPNVSKPWKGKEKAGVLPPRAMWTLPPPPPPPPQKAKEKISPKLLVPAHIWNAVAAEGVQEGLAPKGKARNLKRSRFDSILEQAEQAEQENEGRRVRRTRRGKSDNDVENRQGTRIGEPSSSRVEPPPARRIRQRNPPATAVPALSSKSAPASSAADHNLYSRQHKYQTRRSTPLQRSPVITTTTTETKAKITSRPRSKAARALRPPVLTPGPSEDYEGHHAAWRRLFPSLNCEVSKYKGISDAWHEKMLYEKDGGWRARRDDEVYVKKVLGFARDWDRRARVKDWERDVEWEKAVEEAERVRIAQLKFVQGE